MLTLYHSRAGRGERPADLAEESLPENVAWIDLLRPQPDEVAFVKRTTGLDMPNIADLSEIRARCPVLRSVRKRRPPHIRLVLSGQASNSHWLTV
jgi:Mg2+ and Co2+ transporter CorA